jgi:hypothetical protein
LALALSKWKEGAEGEVQQQHRRRSNDITECGQKHRGCGFVSSLRPNRRNLCPETVRRYQGGFKRAYSVLASRRSQRQGLTRPTEGVLPAVAANGLATCGNQSLPIRETTADSIIKVWLYKLCRTSATCT